MGVRGGGLHEIPVPQQVHHIVVPADIAFENLSRARVVHVRAVRVFNIGGEIPDHGISRVLGAEFRVFLCGRRIFADNGVPETGFLERRVPVVHALFDVRTPFHGRGRIDVVHDGPHGFHQFAAREGFGVGGVQPPFRNKAFFLRPLRVRPVIDGLHVEVPHAGVAGARRHQLIRQKHHGLVHFHGNGAGRGVFGRLVRRVRKRMAHLDIAGKTLGRIDVGTILVQALDLVAFAARRAEAQKANVRRKEFRHVHDGAGGIVAAGEDVEGAHDGFEVGVADRLVNRLFFARHAFVGDNAKERLVPLPLPPQYLRIGFLPAVSHAGVRTGLARHENHLPSKQRIRDFEQQLLRIPVHGKQARVGGHAFLDDLRIFLHFGIGILRLFGVRSRGVGHAGRL